MANNNLNKTFSIFNISFITIALFLAVGCNNGKKLAVDTLTDDGVAHWIGDGKPIPQHDSLFYLDDRTPLFRKEFDVTDDLKSAKLFITAAGYYYALLNGERVGQNMLDPAWTDYSKRIYYTEYDILDMLVPGNSCIGVTLGNGFYSPLPMRMWGKRNLREVLPAGRPAFIGKIVLEYKNGKTDIIGTDRSWKYSEGPLLRNDVYLGEVYNAQYEPDGWHLTGFNDASWQNANYSDGPGGKLMKSFFPPVQVTKQIDAVDIYSPQKDIYIVDMGVNFTGMYKIMLKGEDGDSIVFRLGERIYNDGSLNPMTAVSGQIKKAGMGGPGAPDIAWQTDIYIFGDQKEVLYQPEFTFHTFRYLEIKGLDYKPDLSDIKGLAINSKVDESNHFLSSSQLINDIQDAIHRTFLANMVSVQSDCAAREKFGYGGDLNATSEAFIFNFDMQSFYKKTVYDWVDAMNDSIFVDTAPFVGIQYCGLSWESAFLITQYYLYLYYNDVDFVKEMYESNVQWMNKAAQIHPDGWVDSGLGDHESLIPVPVELTGTSHYLFCAEIMQRFASVMGEEEAEEHYAQLADKIKLKLKEEFWDKPVPDPINRQTLFATLLYYNIVPENEIGAAKDSLLNAIDNAPAGHFTTGIFGTKYILEVLSEYVSPEKVFQIVNSNEFPGWGYMIDNGATTIWETWEESDNVYSNCHPMFGSLSEWFYRWLGGIRPDIDHPGFSRFLLTPTVPEGLDSIQSGYVTPYGRIESNWLKNGDTITYDFDIPNGVIAMVELQKEPHESIIAHELQGNVHNVVSPAELTTGKFRLPGGRYKIIVSQVEK